MARCSECDAQALYMYKRDGRHMQYRCATHVPAPTCDGRTCSECDARAEFMLKTVRRTELTTSESVEYRCRAHAHVGVKTVHAVVNDITWQVGRTGVITPVAELGPTFLPISNESAKCDCHACVQRRALKGMER